LSVPHLPMPSSRPIVQRIFRYNDKFESLPFSIFRTVVALLSIALLVAFGYDLVKQIIDEQFSTRSYTVVKPFDDAKNFGMATMPSVLVYTNILGQPSFENSPYFSVDVSVGCWDPEHGLGSLWPCTLSWHQSVVPYTPDQVGPYTAAELQWNPSYQCNVCSCPSPQRTDAVWVNISMDPTWATNFGVYDNTQLILFDPNSQSLGNIASYLNTTGEPSERAFSTPFSLYYNFGRLLRYTVEYSSLRILKRSWRDVIGLPGIYQSVNLYTIDPIPSRGIGESSQYLMTAVLYPGWGISPRGRGFVVTEEFRTHTILTLLASLGGLWTILCALFAWLFGRSLLFPIFGNKPISPFGLMGRLLSNRRKDEIQQEIRKTGLNQIIRDFVIDLSPFNVPSDKPLEVNLDDEQTRMV